MHSAGIWGQLPRPPSLVTVSCKNRLVGGSNSGMRFSSLERRASVVVVVAVRSPIGFTTVAVFLSTQMSWQMNLPLVDSLISLTRFCFREKASWTVILD